jgi:branched-chain amino acid transport system substrate-binding protein
MRRKIYIPVALILVAVMLIVGGCAPKNAAKEAGVVNICATTMLSGGSAAYGLRTIRGYEMACEDINAAGGFTVAGRNYTLKFTALDDEFKMDKAVSNVRRLLTTLSPKPIFFHIASEESILATMKFNEEEEFIVGAFTGGSQLVATGNKLVAQNCGNVVGYCGAFCATALDLGYRRCVILADVREYGQLWIETWTSLFEKGGGEVITAVPIDCYTETDFYPHLTRILADNPDLIVTVGPSEVVALIMNQAAELGYKGGWVSSDWGELPDIMPVLNSPEKVDTLIVYAPLEDLPEPRRSGVHELEERYYERYGTEVTFSSYVLMGYETTLVLVEAMKKAGTTIDTYKIRAAMPQVVPLPAEKQLWGYRGMLENGHMQFKGRIILLKHGEVVKVLEPDL